MKLDDLRQLNRTHIASWPLPFKAAALLIVFLLILFAAYYLDWSRQLEELATTRAEEDRLKTTFKEKKRLAVNLEPYKKQLEQINQEFGALLKQLPNKSEMESLITDINQAGIGRGLEFDLFKPAAQESKSEFYAELPITVKVNGTYHDLASFASDIGKLPRIVLLHNLNISNQSDKLVMEAVARTYRYLDEEELATQQKASKDAKKGQKK